LNSFNSFQNPTESPLGECPPKGLSGFQENVIEVKALLGNTPSTTCAPKKAFRLSRKRESPESPFGGHSLHNLCSQKGFQAFKKT
jgi:hypothetical protein